MNVDGSNKTVLYNGSASTQQPRIPPLESLIVETWEGGIDSTKWKSWKSPSPTLVANAGINSSTAQDPNGDSNFSSGVLSHTRIPVVPGLTVKAQISDAQPSTSRQSLTLRLTTVDANFYWCRIKN